LDARCQDWNASVPRVDSTRGVITPYDTSNNDSATPRKISISSTCRLRD